MLEQKYYVCSHHPRRHHLPDGQRCAKLAEPLVISGPARVLDGDTVDVAGVRVRLKGVDAAERGDPIGENARALMIGIVGDSDLTCQLTGEKTHRREVGYCFTADGVDREIIAQGVALACERYDSRYVKFEQAEAIAAQSRASYCVRRR
jgi:endonuclease YncB( thermonuclease family)